MYGNKLKPTASRSSSLGKRQRRDPEVSEDAPQDSDGMSNCSQNPQGSDMQPGATDTNTQIPAAAPSIVPTDTFSLTLKQAQRTIQRTIKKVLEERQTELQHAEKAVREAASAKEREQMQRGE